MNFTKEQFYIYFSHRGFVRSGIDRLWDHPHRISAQIKTFVKLAENGKLKNPRRELYPIHAFENLVDFVPMGCINKEGKIIHTLTREEIT